MFRASWCKQLFHTSPNISVDLALRSLGLLQNKQELPVSSDLDHAQF